MSRSAGVRRLGREVRDYVSTYQRTRAEEIKERMNKLYASDVNVVGHLDALKADGGGHGLLSTDKDSGTGNHIEITASEEPGEARGMCPPTH
jgi:hypothetical protein